MTFRLRIRPARAMLTRDKDGGCRSAFVSGGAGRGICRKKRFGRTKPTRSNEVKSPERSQIARTKPKPPERSQNARTKPNPPNEANAEKKSNINTSGRRGAQAEFWHKLITGITRGISMGLGRRPRRGPR